MPVKERAKPIVQEADSARLEIRIWKRDGELPGDLPEAFEPHAEHIARCLREGYVSGEVVDEEFEGWWDIKRD